MPFSILHDFYPESQYGGFTDIDGTIAFYSRINSLLDPSFVVLDAGCGRGEYASDSVSLRRNLRIIKSKVSEVVGIDVDPSAGTNPCIDSFYLLTDAAWPIPSNSIDMVICDYVLEHVQSPTHFFGEASRVLKANGLICIRTTNKWNYFALIAQSIPRKLHAKILARLGRTGYPTVYACNSIVKLRRILSQNSFTQCVVYGYEPEPGYLSFSKAAYLLGVLHQRFAPKTFAAAIFAFARKASV